MRWMSARERSCKQTRLRSCLDSEPAERSLYELELPAVTWQSPCKLQN